MSVLKTLSVVLAFTAVIGLALGSFGFTSVSADRGVQVTVVDDDEAVIGFDAHQVNPNKATIKVANRYVESFLVTVTAESSVTKTVAVGKEKSFSVEVKCTVDSSSDQDVVVTASLPGTTDAFATLERTVEVPPCASDDGDGDADSGTLDADGDDGTTDSDGSDGSDDSS